MSGTAAATPIANGTMAQPREPTMLAIPRGGASAAPAATPAARTFKLRWSPLGGTSFVPAHPHDSEPGLRTRRKVTKLANTTYVAATASSEDRLGLMSAQSPAAHSADPMARAKGSSAASPAARNARAVGIGLISF